MKKYILILLGFGFYGLHAQDPHTDIIPENSTVKKLSTNQFSFTEGPVWYGDSVLLFTDDVPKIFSYNPVSKQLHEFINNSAGCTGLSCDKFGNLIACSLKVVMMNNAGMVTKTLAGSYNGSPLNGPNDLIADNRGGVYFTDPVYFVTPTQDKEAVYYIDPTGPVTRVIGDLSKPNGILLSPDGKKLYVGDPTTKYLYSWDVAEDGSVSGKTALAVFQTTNGVSSDSDGMAIDIYGNLYCTTPLGIQIFSPGGGRIATIQVPEIPSNCDFGGTDFKTLYITARHNLYSIDLNYPGFAVSRNSSPSAVSLVKNIPSVEIFPNPTYDILYIKSASPEVKSIQILSMDGKEQSIRPTGTGTDIQVNISELKSGIYFLRILNDRGFETRQFIKE